MSCIWKNLRYSYKRKTSWFLWEMRCFNFARQDASCDIWWVRFTFAIGQSSAGGNALACVTHYVSLAHRGSRREDNWIYAQTTWICLASLSIGKYIFYHYLTMCLCIPYIVMIMFMEMKLVHWTSIEISAFLFPSTNKQFWYANKGHQCHLSSINNVMCVY